MTSAFSRTIRLLGEPALETLRQSRIILFGLGGVGASAAEALVRAGIGKITLVDGDTVCASNLNRQLVALHSTIGQPKVEAMAARARDINPDIEIETHNLFYLPECAGRIDLAPYDYVIDAIDTVTAKIELVLRARSAGRPIISCMGTGNKLDPSRFEVTDISQTAVCPLCKVMRKALRQRGIERLKVVFSREPPRTAIASADDTGRLVPGSVSFVPPVAGFILAGEVIRDLLETSGTLRAST